MNKFSTNMGLINEKFSYQPKDSNEIFSKSRRASNKIKNIYKNPTSNRFNSQKDFNFINSFDNDKSLENKFKKLTSYPAPKLLGSNNYKNINIEESELQLDCISKVYDLEGDLALKVHDSPTDDLSSIKFIDFERGINFNKLHCGEAVFKLDSLLSRKFLKKYNYCKKIFYFNKSKRITKVSYR